MYHLYCSLCDKVTSDHSIKSATEIHAVVCLVGAFDYTIMKTPADNTIWHLCVSWDTGLCLENDGVCYTLTVGGNRLLTDPLKTFAEFYTYLNVMLRSGKS